MLRKQLLDVFGKQADLPGEHALAGSMGQVVFKVVEKAVALPEGQRTDAQSAALDKFRHEGILGLKGLGETLDQRMEKIRACRGGRSFIDFSQREITFAERAFEPQPLEFSRRPGGEDPEDRCRPQVVRHRLRVHDGEMPQDPVRRVEDRHSAVALNADVLNELHVRIQGTKLIGVMDTFARQHGFARTTSRHIKLRKRPAFAPPRPRAKPGAVLAEFGHIGIVHAERGGQLLYERGEKLFTDFRLDPFDDLPKHKAGLGKIARPGGNLLFQSAVGLLNRLLSFLQPRDITRNREQLLGLAVFVENGGHRDIPPFGRLGLCRGEESGESTDSTLTRFLDSSTRLLSVLPVPELNPGRTDQQAEVADLQCRHAVSVHGQKMPVEIKHLDTIATAFDQASGQFLAASEGFFKVGRCHRTHLLRTVEGRKNRAKSSTDGKVSQLRIRREGV